MSGRIVCNTFIIIVKKVHTMNTVNAVSKSESDMVHALLNKKFGQIYADVWKVGVNLSLRISDLLALDGYQFKTGQPIKPKGYDRCVFFHVVEAAVHPFAQPTTRTNQESLCQTSALPPRFHPYASPHNYG